jgi:predicted metal-dependent phosphoesterase TrpH
VSPSGQPTGESAGSDELPLFDLQSHSQVSDGALGATEVVAAAAAAGVKLLSLTDHDSVDGIAEAREAGVELGVRVVSGVEISAIDPLHGDLHILGYLVDDRDPLFEERLAGYRESREQRADEMSAALRKLGFSIDIRILERQRALGLSIGRPHLAQAVVRHPANAERLAEEGLEDFSAFLAAYLIEGKPGFRRRRGPSVGEAVRVIGEAGGVAVWAHPFWDLDDPADVLNAIDRFSELGLAGVEGFYRTHTREQAVLLHERCLAKGLLCTGSADFHGPDHREFSRFRAFSTYGLQPVLGPIGEVGGESAPGD